jgi:acyl dehydratase
MSLLYWEDFGAGSVAHYVPRTIMREEILAFAAEFDPQPMHADEEAARATMLGGLVASGWHTCAIAMRMMADGFVLKSASMGSPGVEEVRWLRPVRPGDSLTLRARVVETRPSGSRPGMGLIKFHYEMLDQSDNCVMTLVSTMMIARRGFTPASAMASGSRH